MPNKKLPKVAKNIARKIMKGGRKVMKGGNLPEMRIKRGITKNVSCPPESWCFNHNTLLYVIIGLLLVVVLYYFSKSDLCKNITSSIFNRKTDITNVYNQYQNGGNTGSGNSASIYPPQGTHTANYTNPFAPPLRPNHYFMTGKSLDIRDMNVNLDQVNTTSQQGNPPGIILKSHETSQQGIPINVKTSHRDVNFAQIGILTNGDNGETILPLFGRPLATNRNRWQYYTMNDKFQTIKLPVTNKNRSCSGEYGCEEVFDGDNIVVKGFNQSFKATIYESNTPEYIPYV
jgi:hypothetical protein